MKKFKLGYIICFFAVIAITLFSSLFVKEERLDSENRELSSFPERLDNNFFNRIASWYNDRSPFRASITSFYKEVDSNIEKAFFNWVYETFYKNEGSSGEDKFSWEALLKDPYLDKGLSEFPAREDGQVVYGKDDWLFFKGDNALDDYRGANVLTVDEMKKYVSTIERIQNVANSKGIDFIFMVLPNKEQVYADKMPTYTIIDRYKKLLKFRKFINNTSSANFIYPLEELVHERKNNHDTYYMQDTHWNSYGAMIGYRELCKALGYEAPVYEDISIETEGGDLSNMLGIKGASYNTSSIKYKENINVTISDINNWQVQEIKSTNTNNRRCVIAKDSFTTSLLDIIGKDYTYVDAVHYVYEYAEYLNEAISKLKPGDLFVMECVERYFNILMNESERIISSLSQLPNVN